MNKRSYQANLPLIPNEVNNNRDYTAMKTLFEKIDQILLNSGVEKCVINYWLSKSESAKLESKGKGLTQKEVDRDSNYARMMLRCTLARQIYGKSYVSFSVHLAESLLMQWFCGIRLKKSGINVPSKSTLQRMEQALPEHFLKSMNEQLLKAAGAGNLALPQSMTFLNLDILLDTTCVESNIHYPVDWLLLADASRTILKAIVVIRSQGLCHRIKDPKRLLSELNQLAIGLARCKGKDARKRRKKAFRKLKKFVRRIMKHGQTYKKLLIENYEKVGLSEPEMKRITKRMDNIFDHITEATDQAGNRILKGKLTENKDKIISFYDESSDVIVRGKAGGQVEFGSKLMLAEQVDGFIVAWHLCDGNGDDVQLTHDIVQEMIDSELHVESVTGDRGCDGPVSRKILEQNKIDNRICPRSIPKLQEKLEDELFRKSQKRRAQTEARIGILKNNFIQNPILNKSKSNKSVHVAWSVMTHNLWLLARIQSSADKEAEAQAA